MVLDRRDHYALFAKLSKVVQIIGRSLIMETVRSNEDEATDKNEIKNLWIDIVLIQTNCY